MWISLNKILVLLTYVFVLMVYDIQQSYLQKHNIYYQRLQSLHIKKKFASIIEEI